MYKPWNYLLEYIDVDTHNKLSTLWDDYDDDDDYDGRWAGQIIRCISRHRKRKKFRKLEDAQYWIFTHKLTQEPHVYILHKWNAEFEEYEEHKI